MTWITDTTRLLRCCRFSRSLPSRVSFYPSYLPSPLKGGDRRHGFPSSASRRCLLLAALLLFIITTISYSLDLTIQVANIALGPAEPDLTALALMERIYAPDVIFERINVGYFCYIHNRTRSITQQYILTDAIVVWRAWVVSETVVLRIILVVCLLGTTGECLIIAISTRVNLILSQPVPSSMRLSKWKQGSSRLLQHPSRSWSPSLY